ncbi:MAG: carboxypeptidase regulatory-like domain-containing protein [Acidobacteriota bacterium]
MVSACLVLALTVPGSVVSGTVFCEQPGKTVEVRVFAGSPAPWGLTPQGLPLATTQTPCGTPFRLDVPASSPWRVEVHAPGHTAAAFHLTEAGELPPVWLPKGLLRRVEVAGSWQGSLRLWGYLAEPRPWGRWQPAIPAGQLPRHGKLEFYAPKGARVVLWGQDESGAFARWELVGERESVRFAPTRATARVVDALGKPVPGASVVAERAPSGAEAVSDAQGMARVPVGSGQWQLVAWKEGVGLGTARWPAQEPVSLQLQPSKEVSLVPAYPYPGLKVVPRPWLSYLHGKARAGANRIPLLGEGLHLAFWAPGFAYQQTDVEGDVDSVGIRLLPEGRLQVKVVDPAGKPQAGVPVFVDEPERWSLWSPGYTTPSLLARGVTDSLGTLEVAAEPGTVTVRVAAPPWAEAREEVEVPPGQRVTKTITLTPGARCRLQVTDPHGRPLAGVTAQVTRRGQGTVWYSGQPRPVIAEGSSDRDGMMVLEPLLPGPVEITLVKAGFVKRTVNVELPPEGKDLGAVVMEPGASLQGRVVDEKGEGIASAQVYVSADSDVPFGESTETDEAGFFQFPDLPRSGVVFLRAEKQNRVSSRPLKVELPSPPVELVVPGGRVIVGRVVRATDGKPIAAARVYATEVLTRVVGGFSGMSVRSLGPGVETDNDGIFRLEVGDSPSIELHVRAKGFRETSRQVRMEPGEKPRPLLIQLEEGLVLAGRVIEPSGRPAVGVAVRLETERQQARGLAVGSRIKVWSSVTDGEGRFRVADLPPGRYEVMAQTPEGWRAREVAEAGREDLELELEPTGTLTVTVKDKSGAPVAGASVEGWANSGQSWKQITDALGEVRLGQASPGTHSLRITHPNFAPAWLRFDVKAGEESRREVTLEAGGVVEGVVKGLSASELSRCSVSVGVSSATPLPDGSFRITNAPLGKQRVEARVGWTGRFRNAQVEVKPDAPAWVELDFALGFTLTGQVHKQGKPLSGLMVAASREGEGVADTTDRQGQFRLRGLEAGLWKLSVADTSGQVLLRQELELTADRHLELALPSGALAGSVVAAESREPVAEATVIVHQKGGFLRQETTGDDGRFGFSDLPDGDFTITAQAPGYGSASKEVHLSAGQAPEVVLVLPKEAVLELFVQELGGSVGERVWVRLSDASGLTRQLAVPLNRRGRGVISGLPPGRYGLVVDGLGHAGLVVTTPGQAQVVLQEGGSLVLSAPAQRNLKVRVLFPEGLPVPLGWQANEAGEVEVKAGQQRSLLLPAGRYQVLTDSGASTWVDIPAGGAPVTVELP